MSVEHWFKADLTFSNADAVRAAEDALEEEGYTDNDDNLLQDDLKWDDLRVVVDSKGSMPHDCFSVCAGVLGILAQHAADGEALAINIEDGVGTRYPAGEEEVELEDDEVDRLRDEYGWSRET